MSDQETAAKPAKASGNPAVTWTIRIVVFGALGILLILAIMQFMAKRNMESSLSAIMERIKPGEKDLLLDEAEALMVGSYESAPAKKEGGTHKMIYTWKAPFWFLPLKFAVYYVERGGTKVVERASNQPDDIN